MTEIQTQFDVELRCFVVTLPEFVTLRALKCWEQGFLQALEDQSSKVGLLFDSNSHNFESIECLKWLKAFFTEEEGIGSQVDRVAFVQPAQYRVAEVVSDQEAYFVNIQDARNWLQRAPSA